MPHEAVEMNIDSGMPTHFIPVTYDGDPELAPSCPPDPQGHIESRLASSSDESKSRRRGLWMLSVE